MQDIRKKVNDSLDQYLEGAITRLELIRIFSYLLNEMISWEIEDVNDR
jgi:hypothetical protein